MTRPQRGGFDIGDYVDVAARMAEFRDKHPNGSLQPANLDRPFEIVKLGDQTYIVVVAAAYRAPDDERPGIGMAYEQFPGATPYTRNSELQNAETSAWGRAIVAALAADTRKGVASAEDVRNRRAERDPDQVPGQVARAVEAIKRASSKEDCDKLGRAITARVEAGALSEAEAVDLRRKLVARLDELQAKAAPAPKESAA